MEKTLAALEARLEAAIKDAQARYRSSWRIGRWWAKQRIAWLEECRHALSRFSPSLQANEALLHWRPQTIWLKIFSFFDHLFYQIRTQIRQALRSQVKEVEALRKQFIAYGKSTHQGSHPHCLTGEVISGHYTQFEWIQKLGIEDNWEKARKHMIEQAQEAIPTALGLNDQRKNMQKYRRLVYFARAQKELARLTQASALATLQFDENTIGFFDELNTVVEQAKKHGDKSRGINMLGGFALLPKYRAEVANTARYKEARQYYENEKQFLISEKERGQQVQVLRRDLEELEQQFLGLFERGRAVERLAPGKVAALPNAQATWSAICEAWKAKK